MFFFVDVFILFDENFVKKKYYRKNNDANYAQNNANSRSYNTDSYDSSNKFHDGLDVHEITFGEVFDTLRRFFYFVDCLSGVIVRMSTHGQMRGNMKQIFFKCFGGVKRNRSFSNTCNPMKDPIYKRDQSQNN